MQITVRKMGLYGPPYVEIRVGPLGEFVSACAVGAERALKSLGIRDLNVGEKVSFTLIRATNRHKRVISARYVGLLGYSIAFRSVWSAEDNKRWFYWEYGRNTSNVPKILDKEGCWWLVRATNVKFGKCR